MIIRVAILLALLWLPQPVVGQSSNEKKETTRTQAYERLKNYVGKFAKRTKFFNEPLVKSELKQILGKDYQQYLQHVSFSGSGEFILNGSLLYADVSQLHVGGDSSLIFIDLVKRKFYLFWLKGQVADKEYEIYGDQPAPEAILKIIVEEMNQGWGHVAEFELQGNAITIKLRKS